jgi:gliding motility-associated-like protein
MKFTAIVCFFLLWVNLGTYGQALFGGIDGTVQTYQQATEWIKVIVCKEDQSVWALSAAGRVYYKQSADPDFIEFQPTAGISVTDLDGYNASEMYFLAGPAKLYYAANRGPVVEIPNPDNSPMNSIAVVNAQKNVYLESYHGKRDWLAIAAKAMVYSLFRDNHTFGSYTPISTGSSPDCRITSSGFKSLDFQYTYPPSVQCFSNVMHVYYNKMGAVNVETSLPENGPVYNGRVNCTYFEAPFNKAVDGTLTAEYWGTDQGLFVKKTGACDQASVLQKLNFKVNDLDELNIVRSVFNKKYVLAATNSGLYIGSQNTEVNAGNFDEVMANMQFVQYKISGAVNSIATESSMDDLCEQAVWVAGKNGISRLTINPVRISSDYSGRGNTNPIITVSPDRGKGYHNLCNGEEYTLTVNLPQLRRDQYTIKWYMAEEDYEDRTEQPQFDNQSSIRLSSRGLYGVVITTLSCGNVIETGSTWLRKVPDPVFTINTAFPDEISVCDGGMVLRTERPDDRGIDPYQFRWLKDGEVIDGEVENTYKATTPGVYQVQIKNCVDVYLSSKTITARTIDVEAPVISRTSNKSLCFGEKVLLTVNEPSSSGITYRWNRNGTTIAGENSASLEVDKPGNYFVDFVGSSPQCFKRSATTIVVINDQLKLDAPPEVQICTITNQQLKLTGPEGFVKYTWDGVPGTDNFLNVTAPGEYKLEVEDASGCTANTSYIVVPYCPPPVPPNAFSPNGDGNNDTWTVRELINDPAATLKIYNRYGVLVFTGTNRKPAWDGRFNGTDSPVGTYYYVVTQKISARALTGSLMLIR